jgi:hypothetical protein
MMKGEVGPIAKGTAATRATEFFDLDRTLCLVTRDPARRTLNPYMYSVITRQHMADMAGLRRSAEAGFVATRRRAAMRTRAGSTLINLGQRLLDDSAQG